MPRRGRKPTPTPILKIRGSWRAKARASKEPAPAPELKLFTAPGVPGCPDWVDELGREEWQRLTAELAKLGLLTDLDRVALALYCQAYADYVAAKDEVRKAGGLTTTTSSGNTIQHPAVGVMNKAWARVLKALQEFGLSPSSRTGLATAKAKPASNGKARFFKKSG